VRTGVQQTISGHEANAPVISECLPVCTLSDCAVDNKSRNTTTTPPPRAKLKTRGSGFGVRERVGRWGSGAYSFHGSLSRENDKARATARRKRERESNLFTFHFVAITVSTTETYTQHVVQSFIFVRRNREQALDGDDPAGPRLRERSDSCLVMLRQQTGQARVRSLAQQGDQGSSTGLNMGDGNMGDGDMGDGDMSDGIRLAGA
jgi:hypothetical protein